MKKLTILLGLIIALTHIGFGNQTDKRIFVIKYEGIINPTAEDFIKKSMKRAEEENGYLIILMLDTPGGLSESMRGIIKAIFSSKIPVVVYVAPQGARAASAGAFIMLSADITAMAPGTNVGAAHPVQLGGGDTKNKTMKEKIENDAVAYIKSIAKKRHRNQRIAELMVKKSISLDAYEAKNKGIVDIIAKDLSDLIKKLNGFKIKRDNNIIILNTENSHIIKIEPGIKHKILSIITNPTIAYLLFLAGLLGIYVEFTHPGVILPGLIGALSLILAFYAFSILPINFAGILLIIIGLVAFILEAFIVSHGLLTIFGLVAFILGSTMLIDSPLPELQIPLSVILSVAITIAAIMVFILSLGIKAQRRKALTGKEGMIGKEGIAKTPISPEGKVFIAGELWSAKLYKNSEPIMSGEKVIVKDIKDMVLFVSKKEE